MENKLAGQALNVAELIQYQDGSVVSRTVADKPVGTVTVFAFDDGQGLSEHTAPYDAIVHIIDGEVDITISGKTLRAKTGEMVIMPAGQPHSLKAAGKFKMILIMIRA